MSVTLTFPPALHSLDMIPAFDAAEAEQEVVTRNTLVLPSDADSRWQASTTIAAQDLWTKVPATWATPGQLDAGRKTAISDFASALGWKSSATAAAGTWTMPSGWNTCPKKLGSAFKQNAFACPGIATGITVA